VALRNSTESWGWPARTLHWIVGLMIAGMLGFGFYLANAFNPGDFAKFGLVQLHKSFGFVIFALVALRLIWRAANPTPALPDGMPNWQRVAARASHLLLYVFMFAMPLSGWLMASASPLNDAGAYPTQIRNMVFGIFELPDPFQPGDKRLEELFGTIHFCAALGLAALVGVHVAGALKHAVIDRDGVLRRMVHGRAG